MDYLNKYMLAINHQYVLLVRMDRQLVEFVLVFPCILLLACHWAEKSHRVFELTLIFYVGNVYLLLFDPMVVYVVYVIYV